MKKLLIAISIFFSLESQAQLTAPQAKQVKTSVDSLAKVLRSEVKVWTDNKRTIDSSQNMSLKKDSSDLVTIKIRLDAALKELSTYQLIQASPLTAEEIEAFTKVLDKLKAFIIK